MRRCAVYARVSDPRQAQKETPIQAQLDAAQAWVGDNDAEIVKTYIEPGESARTDNRPVFRRMIADARRTPAPFDTILIWKFNRFARNREDSVVHKAMLQRRGIRVVSLTQHIDDSPPGKMLEGMLEVLDEFYSANLAEDTIRGMRKNADEGFHNGGTTPTGYRVKKTGVGAAVRGVFEPDSEFAPLVRRMFARAMAGDGSKTIAEGLNTDGHRTVRGKAWTKQGVLNILRNEVYAGVRVWGKNARRGAVNPDEGPIRVLGAHEALVSPEDFARVQAMLASRSPKRVHPRRLGRRYLLSGLLYCAACGAKLSGHSAKSGTVRYYACTAKMKSGKTTCDAKMLNARRAEDTVAQELARKVLTPEHLAELVQMVNEELAGRGIAAADELHAIDAQRADADRRLQRLYDVLETGKLDLDDLSPRIRHWKARVEEMTARVAVLREQVDGPQALVVDEEAIAAYVSGMRDLLDRGSVDQRRAFLHAWIKRIDVDGDRLTIRYTFPHIPGVPDDDGPSDGPGGGGGGGHRRHRDPRTTKAEPRSPKVLPMVKVGSPVRTRTTDPVVNSHLLYRLSYWGACERPHPRGGEAARMLPIGRGVVKEEMG